MDPMDPMGGGGMTPEQLQAFMEYAAGQGAFTEQDRAIQQQMQMANALRNRPQDQYRTGKGAALGGAGYVLNQYLGSKDVAAAQARDKAHQDAQIAALRQLAAAGQQDPQHLAQLRRMAGAYGPPMASPYVPDPGSGGD